MTNVVSRIVATAAIVALCSLPAGASSRGDCLSYETDGVTLLGTVVRKTFPGPPNFESVEKGDAPEEAWILHLSKPICVDADPENEMDVAERDVTDVQLALDGDLFSKIETLKGGRVLLTGTLFHAHTGHHRTSVLMSVSDVKAVR